MLRSTASAAGRLQDGRRSARPGALSSVHGQLVEIEIARCTPAGTLARIVVAGDQDQAGHASRVGSVSGLPLRGSSVHVRASRGLVHSRHAGSRKRRDQARNTWDPTRTVVVAFGTLCDSSWPARRDDMAAARPQVRHRYPRGHGDSNGEADPELRCPPHL
jgi:hypothetical protein